MNLRDYLLKQGLTQARFADIVSIGRSHLSSVICGQRTCGPRLADRIAKATNQFIKAEDLISGKSLGYTGNPKRAAPKHVKAQKQKATTRKSLSLI